MSQSLISVEMFLSMSDEIKDLKEQNIFLKSENKRLTNEIKNMQVELLKFKPSTSKVNPFPTTAPTKTGQGLPGHSWKSFPVQGSAPVQRALPKPVLSVGNQALRTPYSTPIRRQFPIQGQVPVGDPVNIKGNCPPRGPLTVRKAAPNPGFPRAQSPLQFEYQHVPIRGMISIGNPVSIKGAPKSGNPEAVRAWGYQPVCSQKTNRDSTSTQKQSGGESHTTTGAAYNQLKTAIDSSALPNRTSTQHKRPLPNPSIQPTIPVKKIRQEEIKEPRFVCKIDNCMYKPGGKRPLVFKSLHEHREHMKEAHPEKFLCSRCPFSSNTKGCTKSHEQVHTNNDVQWKFNRGNVKGALCTLCNIKFAIGTIGNCYGRLKRHDQQFH